MHNSIPTPVAVTLSKETKLNSIKVVRTLYDLLGEDYGLKACYNIVTGIFDHCKDTEFSVTFPSRRAALSAIKALKDAGAGFVAPRIALY